MTYRKIGGIHWLSIGRLRLSLCFAKRKPAHTALRARIFGNLAVQRELSL